MHDLFISYAREDEEWVEQFYQMLTSEGLNVWKDSAIPTGKSFGRVIEEAIAGSRAVVVVWSRHSVESDWVRAEATEGLRRGILMPVQLDECEPPLRFRTIQTIDLANWEFQPDHPAYRRLVGELKNLFQSNSLVAEKSDKWQVDTAKPWFNRLYRYRIGFAAALLAALVAGSWWLWTGAENRSRLSLELSAASRATQEEIADRYRASRSYWRYYLADQGGQSLVEKGVLLALEAVKAYPSPEAIEALRQSLVLLQRPLRESDHARAGSSAEIAAGGTRLAWSDQQGIKLMDTREGEKVMSIDWDGSVAGLEFSAGGEYLVAVGGAGGLKVWSIATGKQVSAVAGNGEHTIGYAVDAAGRRIALRQAGLVRVWELPSGQPVAEVEIDKFVNLSMRQSVDLSPDGSMLAFAARDQLVVWDLEKGEERYRIAFDRQLSALSFDPAGKHLLAVSNGGMARLVNLAHGDATEFLFDGGAQLVHFSPAGDRLAYASGGGVRIAAIEDPARVIIEYGHADSINQIHFSDDGRLVASAGRDGLVRVWDIEAARELTRIGFRDQVLAVRFSADAKTLTVIAKSGAMGIWPVTYEDQAAEACRRLKRNLTQEEWRRHLPDQAYRITCDSALR